MNGFPIVHFVFPFDGEMFVCYMAAGEETGLAGSEDILDFVYAWAVRSITHCFTSWQTNGSYPGIGHQTSGQGGERGRRLAR